MPIRRCTVDLPILKKKESPPFLEEQGNTPPPADSWPTMTPRRSARATKGEGWPDQIRKYFTETTLKEDAFEHGKPSLDETSIASLDELQSQVRTARSDNVILRQDLQSLHDREYQLTRRNRDLEDKLLRHRAESVDKDQKKNQRAELDLNIDFTMPNGRAVISERDPAKVEKKVATVPPLEKTSFDSDGWKVTVTSKHKE